MASIPKAPTSILWPSEACAPRSNILAITHAPNARLARTKDAAGAHTGLGWRLGRISAQPAISHLSVPLRDRLHPHLSRLCVGPVVMHCALEKKNHGHGQYAGQTSRLSVLGTKRSALIDLPPQVLFPQACILQTHAAPQHNKTDSDQCVKPWWRIRPTLRLWRESPDSERKSPTIPPSHHQGFWQKARKCSGISKPTQG